MGVLGASSGHPSEETLMVITTIYDPRTTSLAYALLWKVRKPSFQVLPMSARTHHYEVTDVVGKGWKEQLAD